MPALKPSVGTARVVFNGVCATRPVINVMHWSLDADSEGLNQAQIDSLAAGMRAAYVASFIPLVTNEYVLGDVVATDLTSDTGGVGVATGSTAGSAAGTSYPNNVALCVTWKIARHYRGGHPRTYFAAIPTSASDTRTSWVSSKITSWNAAAASFLTAVNALIPADPGRLIALHRYRGHTFHPVTHQKIPTQLETPLKSSITAGAADTRIDTQRRRLGPDR